VNFDQIIALRLPQGNKNKILKDIVIIEIISGNSEFLDKKRYSKNPKIYKKYPEILDAAKKKDKKQLSELFTNMKFVEYKPSDDSIRKYIGEQVFSPTFCIPMTLSNSGSQFAHISNLYMVITSKKNTEDRWLYKCLLEIELKSLIQRKDKTDADRAKGMFTGFSVGPKEKIIATPAFSSTWEIDGKEIIANSMTPGTYEMQIIGYGRDTKKIFETNITEYNLFESTLFKIFKGGDISQLLEPKDEMKKLIGH